MAKKFSATSATIKRLAAEGWACGVVEQTIRAAGGIVFKRDLFNFVDIVAVSPSRGILFVQSTAGGNMASRAAKIRSNPIHAIVLASGVRIQVHDWVKRAGKKARECRVLEIQVDEPLHTKGRQ